jgi:uncharacterized DUF497 family protein
MFDGPVLTQIDTRNDYGETRHISTGKVGEDFYVLVHTTRSGVIRLVTAWRAGRRARRRYQNRFPV